MGETQVRERPILTGGNEARRICIDEAWLRGVFAAGMTAVEIAAELGCSTFPVQKAMRLLGLRRPAKRRPGMGAGPGNSQWRGGRRIRSDGYISVWTPAGEDLEHRVVMARHIGRPLTSEEVVHHRDGDKQNNAVENLELTTQAAHVLHHITEMHAARYGR